MEKAWLTAIAAVLGVSEACHRHETPAAAREVAPLASAAASAEPSASATVEAIAPSATASESASATASAKPAPTAMSAEQQMLAVLGTGTAVPGDPIGRFQPGRSCGAVVRSVCGVGNPQMPARSRAVVAQVSVSVANGIAGDDHVVASLRPRFRACANQGLTQDPNMEGKVMLTVQIHANGEVVGASVSSNSGIDAQTSACMKNALNNAKFGTSTATRHVVVFITQTKQ